ncbi:MAG: hypothetical protein IJF84_00265 [Thermoguttaceae bacterium]|nr:hypothetical protein [Thermoguttaceae bacterium]
MSHCLIVELSEEPIDIDERVTAYEFEDDDDIQYAADYVQDLDEYGRTYEEAVEDFLGELGDVVTYDKGDNSITFNDIEKYFEEDFNKVKDMVANVTMEKFINGSWVYDLKNHICDRFGTYIYHTGECSYPLAEFIRDYARNGSKFYIGGICDYHC